MVAVNDLKKLNCNKKAILEPLTITLAPFAPHLCEEIWARLGNEGSVVTSQFPDFDESYLKEDSVTYPVCINGKKRAEASFATDASKDEIEKIALAMEEVQKWTDGKTVRKVIIVPGRMVNIVVG